jgi:polysaccharide export outer membrane protein
MSNMKLRKLRERWFLFCLVTLAGFIFSGCETPPIYQPPVVTTNQTPPARLPTNGEITGDPAKLRIGETVRVDFSNLSTTTVPLQPFEEQIKDDGTITLPYVDRVQAAGKTTGELQTKLQEEFRKFFLNMNVTVTAPQRYYSVGGEVKNPNRWVYAGPTTVITAIQTSGDVTEYAKKKKVMLIRANGKKHEVNCEKALLDPSLDLPVYPGDFIHVPKRIF